MAGSVSYTHLIVALEQEACFACLDHAKVVVAVTACDGVISDGLQGFDSCVFGFFTDFKMRCEKSKYTTVKALQSIGYDTIASGDSHNDLGMIQASKAGFLFRSTDAIKSEYPEIPAYETYDELYDAIRKVIKG